MPHPSVKFQKRLSKHEEETTPLIIEKSRIGYALGHVGHKSLGRLKIIQRDSFRWIGHKPLPTLCIPKVVIVMIP